MTFNARWIVPLVIGLGWSGAAAAQYPEKPITMIVAYAPGGSTDITARILVPYIEKYLGDGASIIVENRPGAGGEIGFMALSTAAPDGYTIGFVNTPNVITIPIERDAQFNWKNFDLLGNVLDDPGGISVNENGPVKTIEELIAYAKENPNVVTYGTTGIGSDDHLAMLNFQRLTGTEMTHVPFPGASAVVVGLAGGHITLGVMNVGEAMQATASGNPFINLGQMSEERVDIAAEVPTFKEQGYDLISSSLRGVGAPKGIPAEIRDELAEAVAKAAADPEFQAQARQIFAPVRFLTAEEQTQAFTDMEAQLQQLWTESPWSE